MPTLSSPQAKPTDRFVFGGLVFVLIFAPLFFGSIHVWAYSILEFLVVALVFLFLVPRIFSGSASRLELVRTAADPLALLFFAWIAFQVAPIPEWLLKALSPATYRDKMDVLEFLGALNLSSGIEYSSNFLAYSRHPVYVEGLKAAVYAGVFLLVSNTANSRRRLDILIWALISMGLFQALYGLFQVFGHSQNVLWVQRQYKFASGTFIVSNHFAFYVSMVLFLAVGYMVAQRKERKGFVGGLKSARARFQAAVHMKDKGYEQTFFHGKYKIPLGVPARIALGVLLVAGSGAAVFQIHRHLMAEFDCPTEWNGTLNLDWNPENESILRAIEHNPANALYYRKLAMNRIEDDPADEQARIRNIENSIDSYLKSLSLNPTPSVAWYNLGVQFTRKSYDVQYYHQKWLPAAERCFDFARRFDPGNADIIFKIANYWVWRSTMLLDAGVSSENIDGSPTKAFAVEKFQDLFRTALAVDSRMWKSAAESVWKYYRSDPVLLGIVPENSFDIERELLKWITERSGPANRKGNPAIQAPK